MKKFFLETGSRCPKGWGPLHLMCLHLLVSVSFTDAVSNTNMIKQHSIGILTSLVAQMVKKLPALQQTWFRSLGQKDPPRGGHGNPLQYYCLENPMDRGAWRATIQRVSKSQTRLSD